MQPIYYAFYTVASLIIFIQDLKSRSVSVWVLVLVIVSSYLISSVEIEHLLVNIGFLLIQLAVIYIYSTIKKKLTLSGSLGMGDVLFFLVPALLLHTPEFVIYFIFSLIVSCLLTLFLNWKTIPLAGIQSMCLLLWLLCSNFSRLNTYLISWF